MTRLGRYEIEAEIGRGAVGRVHLGHDPRLKRSVALKTYALPAGLAAEQASELRERFLREAQAAAALSHPGIVTVYDADEDRPSGLLFIAMEYVPGRTLRDELDTSGPLSLERACALTAVLAAALDVAHGAGIVHRDIKPANILLREPDGAVKLTDFGVARFSASTLTHTGATVGSPAYMSPEQVRAEPVDGRSDLFSLAAVVYEALCGTRPFRGDDVAALAYSIAHDSPEPLAGRLPGAPPALDAFFARALAKLPHERFS
ncbi:MAG TPA: serine/threonine-protein kinase, partial [Candidatus Polarisedimenticolaceae bacterium]|nr:serine/threonine-protein kinase [Candidatus Polarisedimenticolaceae bacterium]